MAWRFEGGRFCPTTAFVLGNRWRPFGRSRRCSSRWGFSGNIRGSCKPRGGADSCVSPCGWGEVEKAVNQTALGPQLPWAAVTKGQPVSGALVLPGRGHPLQCQVCGASGAHGPSCHARPVETIFGISGRNSLSNRAVRLLPVKCKSVHKATVHQCAGARRSPSTQPECPLPGPKTLDIGRSRSLVDEQLPPHNQQCPPIPSVKS